MKITRISKTFGMTVFEEPFSPKKFETTMEIVLDDKDDNNKELCKDLAVILFNDVMGDVREFAPNAKSFEELRDVQNGIKKGKRTSII